MGIPRFFRWLAERYPLINQKATDLPVVDNFYLDMNGIVHVAASSNCIGDFIPHLLPQKTWGEIVQSVCAYIDALVALVQPRALLYLAFDGVPPRAKMNNQRERRYRAVYEVQQFIQHNKDRTHPSDWFNSSSISPATDFMIALNQEMRAFIKYKLEHDPNWRRLSVVYSGTDVNGEGEHKIQQYFRCTPFPPNTSHCIYGLDADLILLGLISHQPFTFLLREEVGLGNIRSYPGRKNENLKAKFQCLYLNVLREYLAEEFKALPGMEVERFIDDFVVLMLFVGNDFLPRIPTFEIDTGAIDTVLKVYKEAWAQHGYLSENGKLQWPVLVAFMQHMPMYEEQTLRLRHTLKKRNSKAPLKPTIPHPSFKSVAKRLQPLDEEHKDLPTTEGDKGLQDIRRTYYKEYFNLNYAQDQASIRDIVLHYCEGLEWVMCYYFQNYIDWQWFYPYSYAPMAHEFAACLQDIDLAGIEVIYKTPYLPLEQLLCVLPPFSANLLPAGYAALMKDPELLPMFPDQPDIEYDMLCAKMNWASLKVVLPHLDYDQVLAKIKEVPITAEIMFKNTCIADKLYWYQPDIDGVTVSSPAGLFPECSCRVQEECLAYDLSQNYARTVPLGTSATLPSFPSLKLHPYEGELKHLGINVFSNPSKHETLELRFAQLELSLQEAEQQYVGQIVSTHYPHRRLGQVHAVSTWEDIQPSLPEHIAKHWSLPAFLQSTRDHVLCQLQTEHGLLITPRLGILVHFHPLKEYTRTRDGRVIPVFDTSASCASPIELVLHAEDESKPPPLREEFPLHSQVILMTKESYGALGEVVGYGKDKFSTGGAVQVKVLKQPAPALTAQPRQEVYFRVIDLAHRLRKPAGLLKRMLGSVKVKGSGKKYEFGVNLHKDREQLGVLGYSRLGNAMLEWEFSQKTVDLLRAYMQTFPEFWDLLVTLWTQKKFRKVDYDSLFSDSRIADSIALWVHYQPSQKLPWSTGQSCWLSETPTPPLKTSQPSGKTKFWNPGLLFSQSKPWAPPYTEEWVFPGLGSRVVNLFSQGGLQLGAEGTVVSVHGEEFVGVFFDEFVFSRAADNIFIVPVKQVLCLSRHRYHPLRKQASQPKHQLNSAPSMKLSASAKEFIP